MLVGRVKGQISPENVCNKSVQFECLDSSGCYERHEICDNYQHCVDGSDEKDCARRVCHNYLAGSPYFQCPNGKCVPIDRIYDCEGGDSYDNSAYPYIILFLMLFSVAFLLVISRWYTNRRDLRRVVENFPQFPLPPFRAPGEQSCEAISQADLMRGGDVYQGFVEARRSMRLQEGQRGKARVSFIQIDPDDSVLALASLSLDCSVEGGLERFSKEESRISKEESGRRQSNDNQYNNNEKNKIREDGLTMEEFKVNVKDVGGDIENKIERVKGHEDLAKVNENSRDYKDCIGKSKNRVNVNNEKRRWPRNIDGIVQISNFDSLIESCSKQNSAHSAANLNSSNKNTKKASKLKGLLRRSNAIEDISIGLTNTGDTNIGDIKEINTQLTQLDPQAQHIPLFQVTIDLKNHNGGNINGPNCQQRTHKAQQQQQQPNPIRRQKASDLKFDSSVSLTSSDGDYYNEEIDFGVKRASLSNSNGEAEKKEEKKSAETMTRKGSRLSLRADDGEDVEGETAGCSVSQRRRATAYI